MDCTHFRELGSAIIDNEATDAEVKEFNEHIAACEDCAQWFETIKILKDETGALQEEVPEELKKRVMYSVANIDKKPSFFSRFRFTAIAAVVAVIILASNSLGILGSPEPESKQAAPTPTSVANVPQARLAPAPDAKVSNAPAPATLPYDESEFSYVIYIHDQSVCEFLIDSGFEVKEGYRYYKTDKAYDSFKDFSPETLVFNAAIDAGGLVIVEEPLSTTTN